MDISGKIIDKGTGLPIPFASIVVLDREGMETGAGTSAYDDGTFWLTINSGASIVITSVGYAPLHVPINGSVSDNFALTKVIKDLPPVVVTSGHSNANYLWLLLLIPALAKKKAVSGVDFNLSTVLAAGAVIALFKGFDIFDKLFAFLGLTKDKDDNDFDDASEDPNNVMHPTLWNKASETDKQTTKLNLSEQRITDLGQTLMDAFGWYDDDEAQAIGVFKSFKTKLEVSYFSHVWQNVWNEGDLLQWLKGSAYPNDRLSTSEINDILKYVGALPYR